jgi:hypothetical protein
MGGRATIGNDNIKRPSTISGSKQGGRRSIETTELDLGLEQKQGRRSFEGHRIEKDADVVVVDASVLVHALYQVKKWCKDGRQEKIIVPLEGPHCCCAVALIIRSLTCSTSSAEYSRYLEERDHPACTAGSGSF